MQYLLIIWTFDEVITLWMSLWNSEILRVMTSLWRLMTFCQKNYHIFATRTSIRSIWYTTRHGLSKLKIWPWRCQVWPHIWHKGQGQWSPFNIGVFGNPLLIILAHRRMMNSYSLWSYMTKSGLHVSHDLDLEPWPTFFHILDIVKNHPHMQYFSILWTFVEAVALWTFFTPNFMTSLWRHMTSYRRNFYISVIRVPSPLKRYTTRYSTPRFFSPEIYDLGELFEVKVEGQGQGHIWWPFPSPTIWI